MTDLNQNTSVNVDNVEPMKAEFTPDDLRVELDKLQHKLRMSDLEVERERERANGYLEKNQNITAGIFALIEPEILAAFTSMVEEAMGDVLNTNDFENAVESIVDSIVDRRVESEVENAFEGSQFVDGDDVDERISDAIGDSSFDSAVRDVVQEMVNDGDILADTAIRDAVREMINDGDIQLTFTSV